MGNRQFITIIMAAMLVMAAGCAGWGEDGPYEPDAEGDDSGEGEARAQEEATNASDGDSEPTINDGEEEEREERERVKEGVRDAVTDESESEPSTGGEDEITDETSSTGDGDSADSESDTDADETETHTLTVSVVSPEGNPVQNAEVYLATYDAGEDVASGTTDGNGEVTFEVEDGDYEVLVSHDQYAQSSANRLVAVDGGDTQFGVQMQDGDGLYDYTMTVQVVDGDGNPVENELVEVGPPGEQPPNFDQHITDENGEITLHIGNSVEGDAIEQELIVRGQSHYVHLVLEPQHEQIVIDRDTPRVTHEVEVYVDETQPIEGVDVTLERHADGATTTKTTSDRGRVTFDVYPGEYTLSAQYGGEAHSEEIRVGDNQTVFFPYHGTPNNAVLAVA